LPDHVPLISVLSAAAAGAGNADKVNSETNIVFMAPPIWKWKTRAGVRLAFSIQR